MAIFMINYSANYFLEELFQLTKKVWKMQITISKDGKQFNPHRCSFTGEKQQMITMEEWKQLNDWQFSLKNDEKD